MSDLFNKREAVMFRALSTVLSGLVSGSIKAQPMVEIGDGAEADIFGLDRVIMDALAQCGCVFSEKAIKKFGWVPPAERAKAAAPNPSRQESVGREP